jgi:hypothetical protein
MVDAFFVCTKADENRAVRNRRFMRGLCGMAAGMSNPLNASNRKHQSEMFDAFFVCTKADENRVVRNHWTATLQKLRNT